MWRHLSSLSGKFAEDYRTRFQASSGNSDSAAWPGYEAAILRLQRRLAICSALWKQHVGVATWPTLIFRCHFLSSRKKKKSLHCQCVDHSSSFDDVARIHGIGYESLRNVAMHFKAFKSVKNAFYSSAVVTRPSQAPIFRQLGESHSQMYFVFWVRES